MQGEILRLNHLVKTCNKNSTSTLMRQRHRLISYYTTLKELSQPEEQLTYKETLMK